MTDRGIPSADSHGEKDCEKAISILNEGGTKMGNREPDTPLQAGSMIVLQKGEAPPSSPPQKKMHAITIMVAICISVAVVSSDTVILTTALPTIAVALEVSDSGFAWAGATHMIGNAVFIPFWGKFGDVVGRKRALLLAHTIFMVGSLISALCRALPMLLVGRALQGAGGGGLVILANSIIGDRFSEWERTVYARFVAVTWSMAYAVGPIIGGAFAQNGLWRWCFWSSYLGRHAILVGSRCADFLLPAVKIVGDGVSAIAILLFLDEDHPRKNPFLAGLKKIDYLGTLSILCSTLIVLLGLEFGGVNFAWNSVTVLCLIAFGALAFLLFLFVEYKVAKEPLLPLSLFTNPKTAALLTVCFAHGTVYISCAYFLPFYFQSTLKALPVHSGIWFLCVTGPLAATSFGATIYVQKTKRYSAVIRIGAVVQTVGFGLFITFPPYRSWVRIVVFQILVGTGVGALFQSTLLALQNHLQQQQLQRSDAVTTAASVVTVSSGSTAFTFVRQMSYGISVVIGQLLLQSQMKPQLAALVKAGIAPDVALALTREDTVLATPLIKTLEMGQQAVVREAIARGLQRIWMLYVGVSGVGVMASIFVGRGGLDGQ